MKKELEKRIGIHLPDDFIRILTAFSDKFGGLEEGIDKFLAYLKVSSLVHIEDGRGYENTPVEIVPFINTGGDGMHYGYLILAPELDLPDFPVVGYTPGGCYVDFCGNTTTEGIEQIISSMYADDNFAEIDLAFLNSIDIYPDASKSDNRYYGLNYSPDNLITPPLIIPDNHAFHITHDGVGVLARVGLFNNNHPVLDDNASIGEFIKEAQANIDKGFLASALYYLKEAWFYQIHHLTDGKKRQLINMQMSVYEFLGREVYSKRLTEEYAWILERQPPTKGLLGFLTRHLRGTR